MRRSSQGFHPTFRSLALPALLGLLTLSACAEDADPANEPTTNAAGSDSSATMELASDAPDPERIERGKAMFAVRPANCAHCHMEDGTGSNWAPDLTNGKFHHSDGSIGGIQRTIIAGVSEDQIHNTDFTVSMKPSSHRGTSDDQCLDLAHYIRSLNN